MMYLKLLYIIIFLQVLFAVICFFSTITCYLINSNLIRIISKYHSCIVKPKTSSFISVDSNINQPDDTLG